MFARHSGEAEAGWPLELAKQQQLIAEEVMQVKDPALGHTAWPLASRARAFHDPGQRRQPQHPGTARRVLDGHLRAPQEGNSVLPCVRVPDTENTENAGSGPTAGSRCAVLKVLCPHLTGSCHPPPPRLLTSH